MTNINCLAGIACPKCGHDSCFEIAVQTVAEVTDDGAETFGDIEWGDQSFTSCTECQYDARFREFRKSHADGVANTD